MRRQFYVYIRIYIYISGRAGVVFKMRMQFYVYI